jgi:hypothetical protein
MSIQILTDAPGGYVEMEASEVIRANRWRRTNAVQIRFRSGDYVIISGEVARESRSTRSYPALLI